MKQKLTEAELLIAPCGMNCGLCIGYLRDKNKCDGCYTKSEYKPNYCKTCIIKTCEVIKTNVSGFCYDCEKYPCRRLKQLDKRYRNRYHMSMMENLAFIKENGLAEFVKKEQAKWKCPECGTVVSVHRNFCLTCKAELHYED